MADMEPGAPPMSLSSGHIAVEENSDTAQAQPAATAQPELDTGIVALMLLARYHQLPVDPAQIRHQYSDEGKPLSTEQILLASRRLGLKSRLATVDMSRLGTTPLPAIAVMDNGDFVILARHDGDRVLIQHPRSAGPEILSIQVFEASWSGRLILATSRASPRRAAEVRFQLVRPGHREVPQDAGGGIRRLFLAAALRPGNPCSSR